MLMYGKPPTLKIGAIDPEILEPQEMGFQPQDAEPIRRKSTLSKIWRAGSFKLGSISVGMPVANQVDGYGESIFGPDQMP